MPLTRSGKVDRRALQDPKVLRPELDVAFISPRMLEGKALVKIWSEVLGLNAARLFL